MRHTLVDQNGHWLTESCSTDNQACAVRFATVDFIMSIPQSTTPDDIRILFRNPEFNFSGTPRFWANSPFTTHFMNAFSVLIPSSERMVIEILRDNLEGISDTRLKEEIKGVIRQEGKHAALHRHCNQRLINAGYTAVSNFERLVRWMETNLYRYSGRQFRLSMPAAFEHFTARMSREILSHQQFWTGDQDNAAVDFMVWHALEELEHQAVCYDFYRALGGTQRRLFIFLWLCWVPLTMASVYTIQLYFLHRDRVLYQPGNFRRYLRFLGSSLPLFLDNTTGYLRKGYRPWSHSTRALYDRQKLRWEKRSL